MDAKQDRQEGERRREVVARVTQSEIVMAQYRASRAAKERGEPLIPGKRVRAEAKDRRRA